MEEAEQIAAPAAAAALPPLPPPAEALPVWFGYQSGSKEEVEERGGRGGGLARELRITNQITQSSVSEGAPDSSWQISMSGF